MALKERFSEILTNLGINRETLPKGTMALLEAETYRNLCPNARKWSYHPENKIALAYEIETEHKRGAGIVLRNLYDDHRKSHCDALPDDKDSPPYFHNFTPSLPFCWKTGVATLCEGPKDARCLWSLGVPAIAYLGRAPSWGHLACLSRYASGILWIPDSDVMETRESRAEEIRKKTEYICKYFKLQLRTVSLPRGCKDPALLHREQQWIDFIVECHRNFVKIMGIERT